jgi:hypothetical protein
MKIMLIVLILFAYQSASAEDLIDTNAPPGKDDKYYDYGTSGGVTLYDDQLESVEARILTVLNGFSSVREQFIKNDLLRDAGFRSGGAVRFRKTDGAEKAAAVLQGIMHAFSLGIVPAAPFSEVNYAQLPGGEFYEFEAVFSTSRLRNVPPELRISIELEYMLQVGFCDGILIRQYNADYYNEENIAKFEKLAASLPDSPPAVKQIKDRYLNSELPRIKAALERFENPSEIYLTARQNLSDILVIIRNDDSLFHNARPAEYQIPLSGYQY